MWIYEPDENPKRRHHWENDYAGFVNVSGNLVAKCPADLSLADATKLLNGGIEYYPPRRGGISHPGRIYAVHDGVVYRATPTNPGKSYHGFPELRENLPPARELREAILELAREDGSEDKVKKWLR
jgi:hypothetical protein